MEKPAQTQYPVLDLIRRRWSPRAFSDRPVDPQTLHSLFEAARWAPSCSNEQPWSFVVATREDPQALEKLLLCLDQKNQLWARTAPVLMFSVAELNFARSGLVNRHAYHDVGMAIENLIIEALSRDIYVHQMAGYDIQKTRDTLGLPPTHDPVAAVALGYAGDPVILNEEFQQREAAPRSRKKQDEFVFHGAWGRSWQME